MSVAEPSRRREYRNFGIRFRANLVSRWKRLDENTVVEALASGEESRFKRVGAPVGVTGKWGRPGCLLGIRS